VESIRKPFDFAITKRKATCSEYKKVKWQQSHPDDKNNDTGKGK
jgi:hypothetical protein